MVLLIEPMLSGAMHARMAPMAMSLAVI